MATLGDVITEIRSKLRSFTGQHERSTYLTNSITSSELIIGTADGTAVDRGLIEIGDELIYVESSDAGAALVPPYGRGYAGTTAATHTSGTQVIVDPVFTKKAIRDAVENVLAAVYPQLYSVGTTQITFSPAVTSYELPTGTDRVISASVHAIGGSHLWTPLKRWRVETDANATAFASGKAIHILEPLPPGQTVQVVYSKAFGTFTDSSTTLDSVGLLPSMKDVLIYGACVELIQFLEASRQNMDSVENQERAKYVPPGAASTLARQMLGLYQRRVDEERLKLRQLHPMSIRFSR